MRLKLVRRCPGVPEGLDEALDRDGEGWCERCGETVVDLGRGAVPAGRVIRCARVLVAATAIAGCGGSAARPVVERAAAPAAVAVEMDGGEPEASTSIDETVAAMFKPDPLAERMSWLGHVRHDEVDGTEPSDAGTTRGPKQ